MGLERAGMETVAFCEIDPFCRKVLAKHWQDLPIHQDIHNLHADAFGHVFSILGDGSVMPAKLNPKYENAVALYESGFSVGECAVFYGITRQAMHDVLKRRGANMRSQLKYGAENHFYRGGAKASRRAQRMVEKAIKRGILVPEPCEQCGARGTFQDGRNGVQAHHDNYSKPLDVRWLCQPCHHEWHKHNTAKGELEPASAADVVAGGFP